MNSLRARLTFATVLATVLVVAMCGGLLYALIEEDLEDEFDRNLLERARAQSALVEFDEEGLQFEWQHAPELVKAGAVPDWFQVRTIDGELLAHSSDWPDSEFTSPEVDDEDDDESETDFILPEGREARAVTLRFQPKRDEEAVEAPPTLVLVVAEPTAPMQETLARLRMLIGLAGLAGIALSVLLLRLVLWRELKPLDRLADEISRLDTDHLGDPIEIKRAPAELLPVVAQLNAMLARLRDTLRREKEFTAGAAHELRTPLAGIRSKLELALSRDRTPEQHREFASSCLEVSLQMQTIIENLMALARSGSSNDKAEPIEIREALRDAWRPFAQATEAREVAVDWELAGEPSFTTGRHALQAIAANLFENAANYVDDGGRIEIAAEVGDDGFTLEVANTGCSLSPDQAQRVFEPFWRADEVRTGGQAHAGLGLAICRRLAEGAGGELNVQLIKHRFVATLTLPKP